MLAIFSYRMTAIVLQIANQHFMKIVILKNVVNVIIFVKNAQVQTLINVHLAILANIYLQMFVKQAVHKCIGWMMSIICALAAT